MKNIGAVMANSIAFHFREEFSVTEPEMKDQEKPKPAAQSRRSKDKTTG